MPSIEISQELHRALHGLTSSNFRVEKPAGENCKHWSINTDNTQVACSCNPESLGGYLHILEQVLSAVREGAPEGGQETGQVPSGEATGKSSTSQAVPTPAQVNSRPLTYVPPKFISRQGETQFSQHALRWLDYNDLDREFALDILNNPEEILAAPDNRTVYRRDGVDVIYAESNDFIVTIKDSAHTVLISDQQPRLPSQKEQRKLPAPTNSQEMIDRLQQFGFSIEHGGKHWKLYHPDFNAALSMPYTPSDYRWIMNMIREIKLKCGIDLRQPPEGDLSPQEGPATETTPEAEGELAAGAEE